MFKKIYDSVSKDTVDIREKIFRIILMTGLVISFIIMIVGNALDNFLLNNWPVFALFAVLVVAGIFTFKYDNSKIAAELIGLVVSCVVCPFSFIFSGGIGSGAAVWCVLAIFYVFMMFSGKKLLIYLIVCITAEVATYIVAYYHPDIIVLLNSRYEMYLDSMLAVLLVGVSVGLILRFQLRLYEEERKVTRQQQEQMEQIIKSRDTFFANMSHELRTPINTIIGLNELMLREEVSEEVREDIVMSQNAGKMLLSLVNDILDLSQLEIGKMEIVPVEYSTKEMFAELVGMFRMGMKQKKLEFIVDIDDTLPAVLFGDEKRIKQVVLNILSNALKYTEQGKVTLYVTHERQKDGSILLKITVADTGIGIKQEDLARLYDSFRRVDVKKNMKVEGSGLGLAICKQIVDLMDGEILVDSIYRKGTEFSVVLKQQVFDDTSVGEYDYLAIGQPGVGEKYRHSFEAPQARVLIVDDNEMNLKVAQKMLVQTKIQIDLAKSGRECLEKTKEKAYNVILLDHMMPEMDGEETLKRIRNQENGLCKQTPVIAFSANVVGSRMEYMELGFDSCLPKPVDGLEMEAEILKFLPKEIVEFGKKQEMAEKSQTSGYVKRRKPKKVVIASECLCDLPKNLLKKYDIKLIYHYVETDRGLFLDTLEMNGDNISRYVTEEHSKIKVLCANKEDYEMFYADALMEAEDVLYISMTSCIGNNYSRAFEAAKGFNHVHIFDSGQVSCGLGLMVLKAAKMAKEGYSLSEICERLEEMKERVETSMVLPSARIMEENGYIDKITARLCQFLQVHPIVRVRQGKLRVCGIAFGNKEQAIIHYTRSRLRHKTRMDNDMILVTHACNSVKLQSRILEEITGVTNFKRTIMLKACVANICNSGQGSVGIAWLKKEK